MRSRPLIQTLDRAATAPATARAAAALWLAFGAASAAGDEVGLETLREHFSDAYFAAATGAELTADDDSDALRGYVLYAYLEAARIAKALSLTDDPDRNEHDERAAAFLAAHEGEPVADVLARAWLESLARRERSAALVEHYRPEIATRRLECRWLAARIETGAIPGLAPAVIERWLTGEQLPIECERPFDWLRDEGLLDAEQTERRVRLLLANGQAAFARLIARPLPERRAAPLLTWADLITAPRATLDRLVADPDVAVEFDALLDGFSRLARDAPEAAVARLGGIVAARGLDETEASLLRRALAYGLAWDRDPRALDYFARISAEHVDDYTLQWQARAALWAAHWPLVAASIEAMSADVRDTSAWTYWHARAIEALAGAGEARAAYESILADDNFYSALAAARLGRPVVPHQQRFEPQAEVVEALGRREAFARARELRAVELPSEALREWHHAQDALAPAEQRQSVHLAADWGWYDVAVATATSHGIFFDYRLLYPRPYRSSVAEAARLTRLDAPLIYAVMRQESLYRADAASPSGALGLMQLVPGTAARTAADWERPRPSRADLFDAATSVELGAAHLRDLVERFGRELPPALAAYNAGPAAVDRWLPEAPRETDVWIENIPYNETRTYVRRVLWHSLVFKWLAERRPQSAESWLGTIARPGEAPESG